MFVREISSVSLAEKLGVTPQTVSHWISRRRDIPYEHTKAIESEYGIPYNLIGSVIDGASRINLELILSDVNMDNDYVELFNKHENMKRNYARLLERENDRWGRKREEALKEVARIMDEFLE